MADNSSVFTSQEEVTQVMAMLEDKYGKGGSRLKVSDVVDEQGNQYINLVQEGGGMLGIALVGFTWVLEQMGIRFWRLAGTSAGAINTIFLAAVGEKSDVKSEKILSYLSNTNFLKFADGHPVVSRVITRLTRNKNYLSNTIFFVTGLAMVLLFSLFFNTVHHSSYLKWFILMLLTFMTVVAVYMAYLWTRFKKRNFGLCRGDFFNTWLKEKLAESNITTVTGLKERAYRNAANATLKFSPAADAARTGADADIQTLQSDVTMIACDITTQMKVEFPRMAMLYGLKDDTTNPAEFVRASMSIPVFFEAQGFKNINGNDPGVIKAWKDLSYTGTIPTEAYFVDGGIISNFPINVFHNPNIRTPRLPVFGARLNEGEDGGGPPDLFTGIGSFAGAIFSTIRFNYDKEFLMTNNFYIKYVSQIDVKGFNWLNFAMKPAEQKRLFAQGVKAAGEFLKSFDWEVYKKEREDLYDAMNPNKPFTANTQQDETNITTQGE